MRKGRKRERITSVVGALAETVIMFLMGESGATTAAVYGVTGGMAGGVLRQARDEQQLRLHLEFGKALSFTSSSWRWTAADSKRRLPTLKTE